MACGPFDRPPSRYGLRAEAIHLSSQVIGVHGMKFGTAARVLALGVILPFAVIAATSAGVEEEEKEGGVVKGAVKGAAVGAILPGVGAKTGAAVGAVSGGVKKAGDKKDEKK